MYKMNKTNLETKDRVTVTLSPASLLARIRFVLGDKVTVTLTFVLIAPGLALAQALPEKDAYVHEGVATCAASQCHGSAVPREGSGVFQNEYVTWTQNDPHSQAYLTLGTEASTAIARRLGIDDARTSGPVPRLSCRQCIAEPAWRAIPGLGWSLLRSLPRRCTELAADASQCAGGFARRQCCRRVISDRPGTASSCTLPVLPSWHTRQVCHAPCHGRRPSAAGIRTRYFHRTVAHGRAPAALSGRCRLR